MSCDLHNSAIQAYFNDINCDRLSAQILLQEYFKSKKLDDMVIVATDAGSSKKAYKYSEFFNCPIATTVIGEVKGKTAVIFDDEIDTAGSMMETVGILERFGAKEIYAGCTHGVLSGPAIERIQKSALKELVITNTIPLPPEKQIDQIKVLSIAPLFAEAIKRLYEHKAMGDLFEK